MTEQPDLVVSADGHILEPTDLFKTRLPKHLRDRAVWEEGNADARKILLGASVKFACLWCLESYSCARRTMIV